MVIDFVFALPTLQNLNKKYLKKLKHWGIHYVAMIYDEFI